MQSPVFSQNVRRLNVDDPKRNQALTEIERSLAKLLKKYSHVWEADVVADVRGMVKTGEKDATHQSEQEQVKLLVERINDSIKSLVVLSAFKAIDLTDALIRAANEKGFLICALANRSLLEVAALLHCFKEELTPYLKPKKFSADDFEKLRKIVVRYAYGGLFDFVKEHSRIKSGISGEGKWRRPEEEHLPRFTPMVRRLAGFAVERGFAKNTLGVEERYAKLSEFAHPTFASSILYGDSERVGVFRLRQESRKQRAYLLDLTILPAYATLGMIEELLETLARVYSMFSTMRILEI